MAGSSQAGVAAASGTELTTEITIQADTTVDANFKQGVTLGVIDIEIVGAGSITITPDKESYNEGDEVTLTAQPRAGWKFVRWETDINLGSGQSATDNTLTVTLKAGMSFKAIFESIAQPLYLPVIKNQQ